MASTGPVDDLSRQVIHGLVGNSDPKATSTGLLQEAQSWLTSTNSSLSGTVQARATAKLKTSIPLFSRLELKEVQLQVDLWADFVANSQLNSPDPASCRISPNSPSSSLRGRNHSQGGL